MCCIKHPATERLLLAVEALATGAGDVRSRLRSAFYSIMPLRPDDLPAQVRADFEWVMRELTKREPTGREGRLNATLYRMRNRTGVRIAQRIVVVYRRVAGGWG